MIAGSMERRKFFWGLALFAVVCCIFFASAQLAFAATQTGTVATTALNIRSGPGTNYRSMGLLSITRPVADLYLYSSHWYRKSTKEIAADDGPDGEADCCEAVAS